MAGRQTKTVKQPPQTAKQPRTRHGIKCNCGSENVSIRNTRTRPRRSYPPHMDTRVRVKRQECFCADCKRRWWRRVEETERELPAKKET